MRYCKDCNKIFYTKAKRMTKCIKCCKNLTTDYIENFIGFENAEKNKGIC